MSITQYCLLLIFETWKKPVHKENIFGALLTELSNAFDCISDELSPAKLHAYGLSLSALE